jgi:hypothetical protein
MTFAEFWLSNSMASSRSRELKVKNIILEGLHAASVKNPLFFPDPRIYKSELGSTSGRPINYGSGQIRILAGHLCGDFKNM